MILSVDHSKSAFDGFDLVLKRSLDIPDLYSSVSKFLNNSLLSVFKFIFGIIIIPILFLAVSFSLSIIYLKLRKYYKSIVAIKIVNTSEYEKVLEINLEARKAHRLLSKLLTNIDVDSANFVDKSFIWMFKKFNGVLKSIVHTTSLKLNNLNPASSDIYILKSLNYKDLNSARTSAYAYKF